MIETKELVPITDAKPRLAATKARNKVSIKMIEEYLDTLAAEGGPDPGNPLVYLRSVIRDPLAKTADRLRAAEILIGRFVPQVLEIHDDQENPTVNLSVRRMQIALAMIDDKKEQL